MRIPLGGMNENGQILVRRTNISSTTHNNATIYIMRCTKCGNEYGANSCDAYERLCPNPECQGGKPGEPIDIL